MQSCDEGAVASVFQTNQERRKLMKNLWFTVALVGAACILAGAQSSTKQYQDGTIIAVEKQAGPASTGGTDAPTASSVDEYNISIQVGDTLYVVRYKSHSDQDLSWTKGKDVQVRTSGSAIYVKKANGKEAKGSILKTTKAPAA
jgi:hypothetical protein